MANTGVDTSITLRTVVLPFPNGLGGSVLRLVTAVQPDLDMHTSSGRVRLAESLVCRLTTPRATLIDVVIPPTPAVASYGTDLGANINLDMTARQIAMAGASADAECIKDPRVVSSQTSGQAIGTGPGKLLLLPIVVTDGAGPFSLVLSISNVSVQVLSAPT